MAAAWIGAAAVSGRMWAGRSLSSWSAFRKCPLPLRSVRVCTFAWIPSAFMLVAASSHTLCTRDTAYIIAHLPSQTLAAVALLQHAKLHKSATS